MFSQNFQFINISGKDLDKYNDGLKKFEKQMSQNYPLGNDTFTINHGKDYFAFFRRLGETYYFLVKNNDDIIGTSCAILRKMKKSTCGQRTSLFGDDTNFWYLCDLKINEKYRGNGLTKKLFLNMFWKFIGKSWRGYLVSMDPGSKQIVHMADNISSILGFNFIGKNKLLIYSVNLSQMKELEPILSLSFGNISYLSLNGTKDLILGSTTKPIDLYHLQHGVFAEQKDILKINKLPDTASIMFCLPENSHLVGILNEKNVKTDITATIISRGMDFFDWNNILTSDI